MGETFRTLHGFLAGSEPAEETYFKYSATLRILGDIPKLEDISTQLGLQPTSVHLKGEKRDSRAAGYRHDMWSYRVLVEEDRPLQEHIDALWKDLEPHKDYLLELKKRLTVDVFLGYQTNCDHAGVEVPHSSLIMFAELEIPFGLSIIVS
jgi:hypothetical protein